MKKIALLLMMILATSIVDAKKPKNMRLVMVAPIQSETPVYENDSIQFVFEWETWYYDVKLKIYNNSKSRIYIEWENARVETARICFDDDSSLSYEMERPDEVVHSGSFISKRIGSLYNINLRTPMFHKQLIKKYGETETKKIIIPVKHNGMTKDYIFELKVIGDIK